MLNLLSYVISASVMYLNRIYSSGSYISDLKTIYCTIQTLHSGIHLLLCHFLQIKHPFPSSSHWFTLSNNPSLHECQIKIAACSKNDILLEL